MIEKLYDGNSLKPGVYKLTNRFNGRVYYGSCKRFKERWAHHECLLINGKHSNKFLQADFNKCGIGVFIFEVIEVVEGNKQSRLNAEQTLLDKYWDNKNQCYNLSKFAKSSDGIIHTYTPEETRKKRSLALKGLKRSKEIRQKMSEAGKLFYLNHPEMKQILSNAGKKNKGIKLSKKHKKKISKARKGMKFSEEHKKNISKAKTGNGNHNFGKKFSEEHRQKMSNSMKGKLRSEETKNKLRGSNNIHYIQIDEKIKKKIIDEYFLLKKVTKAMAKNYGYSVYLIRRFLKEIGIYGNKS